MPPNQVKHSPYLQFSAGFEKRDSTIRKQLVSGLPSPAEMAENSYNNRDKLSARKVTTLNLHSNPAARFP